MTYKHKMNRKACSGSRRSALKRVFLAFSCLGLSLLTACANVIPPCGAKTSPPSSEFRNTKWELVRWNLAPNNLGEVRARQIPQGEGSNPIHIQFDANSERLSGTTGCNRFTARISEDARGFTLDKIVTTRMACAPQRMELENDFLYALNDYQSIVRNGDQLLMIGSNREVLSFMQRPNATK